MWAETPVENEEGRGEELNEGKGPARVVPTTDGEHLSIRSRAVTGSPITPKANFHSPNPGSSRVVIVDSYKDMESTVDVSDSTLSFVACIPIRVATDSWSQGALWRPMTQFAWDEKLFSGRDLEWFEARPTLPNCDEAKSGVLL
ncbi:hypothetical protein ZIOFF_074293 (mitochondrion) [Zingiber officinale]|uniref:Uncharacterized protein n=1 Tax=Zingiber officinale TaxID=94328 RepID=A0A8J5BX13_ZINOF|nr:hypothetical protein ZIOFF_074293 [Zingiber officinale]